MDRWTERWIKGKVGEKANKKGFSEMIFEQERGSHECSATSIPERQNASSGDMNRFSISEEGQ